MAIFYLCATYDDYDPNTGLFNTIQNCIEWDTDTQGSPPNGATQYATLTECYEQSECVAPSNLSEPTNWCGININEVSLVEKNNTQITVQIKLSQSYDDTYIECALYDIDNNIINNWTQISNTPNLNMTDTYIIDIASNSSGSDSGSGSGSGSTDEVCVLAFRLVKKCKNISGSDSGSESGSGSGSENSGSEIGSEDSGSGTGSGLSGECPNCIVVEGWGLSWLPDY